MVETKPSTTNQTTFETMSSVSSANIVNSKWDVVISNGIVKTGLGLGAGIIASAVLFKRRQFPVWIGLGFGLGRSYAEGDSVFRDAGLRSVDA